LSTKATRHRLALDERGLMLQYPAIRAIVHTSCKTGAGIPELRQAIEEALAALPHVNDWIPLTWFAVKEKLAALGKDFLPYESYEDLCEAEGITHEAAQHTLARSSTTWARRSTSTTTAAWREPTSSTRNG
jgi:internalin A